MHLWNGNSFKEETNEVLALGQGSVVQELGKTFRMERGK